MDVERLEAALVKQLALRGLSRAPGPLAFVYQGSVVRASIKESLYRGLYVTLHDKMYGSRQFRSHEGAYDWNDIAAAVVEIVDSRRPPHGHERTNPRVANGALSIQPSTATPGRVRVKLSEMELDPLSAMQLYAVLQHALPAAHGVARETEAATW